MIKKYLLGLLLFIGVGLTSFSSSWKYDLVGAVYPSIYDNNYDVGVLTKGTVITQSLGYGRAIFLAKGGKGGSFFYWSKNGLPYIYDELYWDDDTRNIYEGYLKAYKICDVISSSSDVNNGPSNCGNYIDLVDISLLDNFFSSINTSVDYYGYNKFGGWSSIEHSFSVCFSSESFGKSVCFIGGFNDYSYGNTLTGSLNYAEFRDNIGISTIPDSEIGTSPGVGGGGGGSSTGNGNVLDITDSDYIGYFENRAVENFNVSDCYVGTDDLVSLYGTAGLSFNYGKGKTIFDLFNSLHGTGSGSEYLSNVATWTRTWKLNYGNWFDRNSVGYMGVFSIYTGGGVEFLPRDYTGFIFSGRPASLYFMSNNLYNKFGFYGDTFELVGYCDMKLNGTPFNQVFSTGSATYNNVLGATYSNYYNTQYYVDGSGNLVLSRDPGDFNIYLSEWLDYEGSGEDYSDYFAGFNEFYSKLDEKFSNINLSNSVGIIPEYILFALFGIILFKIFKH